MRRGGRSGGGDGEGGIGGGSDGGGGGGSGACMCQVGWVCGMNEAARFEVQ